MNLLSTIVLSSVRKKKTNYFIVSLAFADLLVALVVMPFAAIELTTGQWRYGEIFCLVRTSLDVLLTTASILHLCCIALDRFVREEEMARRICISFCRPIINTLPFKIILKFAFRSVKYYSKILRCSVCTNVCACFSRYYAICCQPLVYRHKMTPVRVAVMLGGCWLIPTFISFLPIMQSWNAIGIEDIVSHQ